MSDYPEIRHALATAFSIQTGLSDQGAAELFQRMLANPNWRQRLERELREAFSSPATPWRQLLQNDRYEVAEAESDAEAREYVAALLWRPTFPRSPVP
jgi:hypothetical protein